MRATAGGLTPVGLGLALLLAPAAEAGPWVTEPGHFYVKLSYQALRSTTYVAPDGTPFEIPRWSGDDLGFYASVGVARGVALFTGIPLRSSDLADAPDDLQRETGIGDLQAGLQVHLGRSGPWVFSASALAQAPTGDETRSQGLQATGSGVFESQAWVSGGRSLAGGKGWGFVELGYSYRSEGLRDGLLYGGQLGWNLSQRLLLMANVRGLEPFSHAPGENRTPSLSGFGDRVTYLVYGPSLIVKLGGGAGLQLDLEGTARARNVTDGLTLRVGVSYGR